ncbi:hypothetical protein BH11PSE8_BH11PSE8_20690 [soil metagenome]
MMQDNTEHRTMPKIIVNAFLIPDGVMQAPGGPEEDRESGFAHGAWHAEPGQHRPAGDAATA